MRSGPHFSAARNWITISSMSSGVRVGWWSGRDVRSSNPESPWASQRWYHLVRAVRLTPPSAATWASGRPASMRTQAAAASG
jgi:hypothetical protein